MNTLLRLALAFAALALLVALPALAADPAAAGPPISPELAKIAVHAGGIAVIIRALVALLRSPMGGMLWVAFPPAARVMALVVLGVVAAILESVAGGMPIYEAIFIAVGGVGAAVTSKEMQDRVIKPKKKPPVSAVR